MPQIYFEPSSLKELSNTDLLKNYEQLEIKISKVQSNIFSPDIITNLEMLINAYDNEIQERIRSGKMDDDELDTLI